MSSKCKPPNVRLLPGDFQKYVTTQRALDDVPKNPKREEGFFVLPEELKGAVYSDRKFLVFYFDDEGDYDLVLGLFKKDTMARSHPDLDSVKLAGVVRAFIDGQ